MATAFKEGDRVRVLDREPTSDDLKAALYFNHFRTLAGTVQKVYPDDLVAVEVDSESLPEPIVRRHVDVQETMKSQWLDKLSEEARNRLTDQERDFRLRYTILVAVKDLTAQGKDEVTKPKDAGTVATAGDVRRATLHDLEAAEEAELQRRRANREA